VHNARVAARHFSYETASEILSQVLARSEKP
jgi:hypothetical protein